MIDSVAGRHLVQDTFSAIVGGGVPPVDFRINMLRVMSTFDHPILFGTFCSLVGAILLYAERTMWRRILSVSFCFVGVLISFSSAAMLSFFLILALYSYDQAMSRYPWRWKAVSLGLATFCSALFAISNQPIGWLISHFTLDPQTGYWRILIWDFGLNKLSQSPVVGFGFNSLNYWLLDKTVDTVWLVVSLRFGIPMAVLLILLNITAILPVQPTRNLSAEVPINQMRTAFSIVLIMFMFTGLTVHYWNYIWIFWGLCIGIRSSLRELSLQKIARPNRSDFLLRRAQRETA